MALLMVTMGTTLGDFVSGVLSFGLGPGSLMLGVMLATVLTIDFTATFPNERSYWLLIAVVRTAGTVMGDFLSGEEGVDLGFAVGASLVEAVLLAILLIPSTWKAAERRWPTLGAVWGMARNDLGMWRRSPAPIAAASVSRRSAWACWRRCSPPPARQQPITPKTPRASNRFLWGIKNRSSAESVVVFGSGSRPNVWYRAISLQRKY